MWRLARGSALAFLVLTLGPRRGSDRLAASEERAPGEGAPAPASPAPETAEVREFLAAWAARSREVRSLAIRFRQEKKLRILRRPRVSEGDLAYADGKLSVVVRRGEEVETELLLADGEIKIHYPRLKRLEVARVAGGAGPPAAADVPMVPFFAGDPRQLTRSYRVALEPGSGPGAGGGKEERMLVLEPREPSSPVKRIEIVFAGFDVSAYRQVEASGDEAAMTVLASEVNARIPEGRFQLKVPEGTVVVRLDGK